MSVLRSEVLMIFIAINLATAADEGISNKTKFISFQFGVDSPEFRVHPCKGVDEIVITSQENLPPDEENKYWVFVGVEVYENSLVVIKLDSDGMITLGEPDKARIYTSGDTFKIRFYKPAKSFGFRIIGPAVGLVPYMTSLKIDHAEFCENPRLDFLHLEGYRNTAAIQQKAPEGCGRRKVEHTELIVNGESTKPGDWPWHVALYKLAGPSVTYICGGTLISKTLVLTAAHCVTIRGDPVIADSLSVVLGKYNLIGGDLDTQERKVHSVIVHEEFALKNHLENDIALVKLKSEASFNNYVQPSCIWYDQAAEKLPHNSSEYGTVVGWGLDQTDSLSAQLKQATMPMISYMTCVKKNPLFYGSVLNDKKFCAGWANGTSACNGDSGGGFTVFVPDAGSQSHTSGSWYVRGIVSLSAARHDAPICDPNQYVVFTDVAKYVDWIKKHLSE